MPAPWLLGNGLAGLGGLLGHLGRAIVRAGQAGLNPSGHGLASGKGGNGGQQGAGQHGRTRQGRQLLARHRQGRLAVNSQGRHSNLSVRCHKASATQGGPSAAHG